MAERWDEEEMLAALRQIFEPQGEPPPDITESGKRMFAWHAIGKELAQLTFDSAREPEGERATRAEVADTRALTFCSARLAIELEFTAEAVLGQVVPPQTATIAVQFGNGRETELDADGTGCFSIRPAPPATFRLRCQADTGPDVLTGWIAP